MKKAISILAFLVIAFTSCNTSGSGSKKITGDTCLVSIIFKNPYKDNLVSGSSAFRVVRDSVKIDGERVVHVPDTIYYVPMPVPVLDMKDSTHRTILRNKFGGDSIITQYPPVTTKSILTDYNDRQSIKY